MSSLLIRNAVKSDCPLIFDFIKQLAEYEKLPHLVTAHVELLEKNLFSVNSHVHVLIAEYESKPAGFALYFYNFSTFLGKQGIYLEDLFVIPELRSKGIGISMINLIS